MIQSDEIKGKIYDRKLFGRLLKYGLPYKQLILAGILLIIVASLLRIVGPYLTKLAIDDYIASGNFSKLKILAALYVGVLAVNFMVSYAQAYITQLLGQKVMYDLRSDIFGHLQKLSFRFFDRNPVGRLMTRVTSDVQALNDMFTQGVISIFGDLFLLTGIVIIMMYMNWRLALLTFTVIPVLFVITMIFKRKVRVVFRNVRKWLAQINTYVQENITGMSVVQVFNREEKNFEAFKQINWKHTEAYLKMIFYYAIFYPAIELVSAIALGIVLWQGGILKSEGLTTYGALVAFIQYAQMFFMPISDLSEKYNILQSAMASAERIFNLLDTRPDIASPAHGKWADPVRGKIAFKNVWFAYNEPDYVLKDVSFQIMPGEKIAIVGHTGAGKTSLINLLARHYDIQKGEIWIDDIEVRQWDLQRLRKSMAVVLQDVFLFSGSILENVRLHDQTISENQVVEACKQVNAHSFIEKLPNGYHTVLNERGTILSMGERQLLSFARALVVNPPILILDEATSNIDTETEILIQQAVQRLMEKRTALIIAHRLSTIQHVDRILVFHKGRLREEGTHQQLLSQRGIYYHLYQLQYKDQALAINKS
ncbi:ABC transporter related protein [Caldithrix abyssi DSM 13497]|uniref:ABC transporter related protein n=1 Tax=Caldithrix abyssi DSM 13497 TaxID=880073 RepID=H1XR47_CALAY|nr:ABC transporter ATP-binding protein [Caldithrix abyssi]APF17048.1 ATP-binding cassette, subfamily B [Caldithrix abyssi DSM 13497]EHO41198.1 ABC transporter related protein [Caldithrix abyssi DSM 13497]